MRCRQAGKAEENHGGNAVDEREEGAVDWVKQSQRPQSANRGWVKWFLGNDSVPDRAALKQGFHELMIVHGAGQQQAALLGQCGGVPSEPLVALPDRAMGMVQVAPPVMLSQPKSLR